MFETANPDVFALIEQDRWPWGEQPHGPDHSQIVQLELLRSSLWGHILMHEQ